MISSQLSPVTSWKVHAKKLSEERYWHSAVAIDDHRFIVTGGYNNSKLSSVELVDIYDKSNTTIQLPQMVKKRYCHSSCYHNGYLYVIGGWQKNSIHRIKITENGSANDDKLLLQTKWEKSSIPSLHENRAGCSSVTYGNRLIVIGGGSAPNSLSSIVELNLAVDENNGSTLTNDVMSWKNISDMKFGRHSHASVVVKNKVYILGGLQYCDGKHTILKSMEILNMESNKINEGENPPVALYSMAAVAVGRFIVVTGGLDSNRKTNLDVFLYDTENETWHTLANHFIQPRCDHCAVVLRNNTIATVGGVIGVVEADGTSPIGSMELTTFSELVGYPDYCNSMRVSFGEKNIIDNQSDEWVQIDESDPFFNDDKFTDLQSILSVRFFWKDQGCGNQKGKLRICLINLDNKQCTLSRKYELAPHDYTEVNDDFLFDHRSIPPNEKGYKFVLEVVVGDSGDHEFYWPISTNEKSYNYVLEVPVGERRDHELYLKNFNFIFKRPGVTLHYLIKNHDKIKDYSQLTTQKNDKIKDYSQLITQMISNRPDAVNQKDANGDSALHQVLKNHDKINDYSQLVSQMVSACPGAVNQRDANGDSALLILIKNHDKIKDYSQLITKMISACPDAVNQKDANGDSALHRVIKNHDKIEDYSQLITQMVSNCPSVIKVKDNHGLPPIYAAVYYLSTHEYDVVALDVLKILLNYNKDASKVTDFEYGNPLIYSIKSNMPSFTIGMIIDHCPQLVMEQDDNGDSVAHYILKNCENREDYGKLIMYMILKCPTVFKKKDKQGLTLLHTAIRKDLEFEIISKIVDAFHPAVVIQDLSGSSPFSTLTEKVYKSAKSYDNNLTFDVNLPRSSFYHSFINQIQSLRYFMPFAKNSRYCLNQFCTLNDTPTLLKCLFWVMTKPSDDINFGNQFGGTQLDLNHKVIPGFTFLELLVDLDTEEAVDIFFQIKESLQTLSTNEPQIISIMLKENDVTKNVQFQSLTVVSEGMWREVADRARLSNIEKLKEWGETYGRFLKKYRIEKDEDPKHISDTCVVIIGTRLHESDGKLGGGSERKVTLKFMTDKHAFCRELRQRERMGFDSRKYVVGVLEAYSAKSKDDLIRDNEYSSLIDTSCINFDADITSELCDYGKITLRNNIKCETDNNSGDSFDYILVMECDSVSDLSDIMIHQNIAARDMDKVIHIAIKIAKCLQFFNETKKVIHGNVNECSFIIDNNSEIKAIDLDNSVSISESEEAGAKQTSTGYVPPEQASVLYYQRNKKDNINNSRLNDLEQEKKMLELDLGDLQKLQNERLINRFRREIQDLEKEIADLNRTIEPEKVKASSQYDMWSFGVLLFKLCTGRSLFEVDSRECVVDNDELKKIRDWSEIELERKLDCEPFSFERWKGMKSILAELLKPESKDRFEFWEEVINRLENAGKRN